MLKLSFDFDEQALMRHIEDIGNEIVNAINTEAASKVRETVLDNILDSNNWNPAAVYSPFDSKAGQKYDLRLSGQLLKTIGSRSQDINPIAKTSKGFDVGVGNISVLDSLRSQREEFGSTAPGVSQRSKDAPYWRFVVFGHSPPRYNLVFHRFGNKGGKDTGAIVPGNARMRGTPPTYMFDNGVTVSIPQINEYIDHAIGKGLTTLDRRWG